MREDSLQYNLMRLEEDLDLHVILGRPHIEATHVTEFLDDTSSDETLDGEGTEGTTLRRARSVSWSAGEQKKSGDSLVTSKRSDDRSGDCLRVHARLKAVSHSDEGPIHV